MRFSRAKIWFSITVILGIVTSMIVTNHLKGLEQAAAKEDKIKVVVAAAKVPEGTQITSEMVKTVLVSSDFAASTRITDINQVINKFTTVDLWPEDLVILDKLTTQNTSSELPYKIPKGERAYTVAVNSISGVAGLIKPNHYTDILLSYKKSDMQDDVTVAVMLQNVLILAVGSEMNKKEGPQGAESLTLAVTPKEAQLLMLVESIGGKIKFALKPSGDKSKINTKTVNFKELKELYP